MAGREAANMVGTGDVADGKVAAVVAVIVASDAAIEGVMVGFFVALAPGALHAVWGLHALYNF